MDSGLFAADGHPTGALILPHTSFVRLRSEYLAHLTRQYAALSVPKAHLPMLRPALNVTLDVREVENRFLNEIAQDRPLLALIQDECIGSVLEEAGMTDAIVKTAIRDWMGDERVDTKVSERWFGGHIGIVIKQSTSVQRIGLSFYPMFPLTFCLSASPISKEDWREDFSLAVVLSFSS
ncbi:hypothetical protein CALVIDRAFT_568444 [Calocera viscosa TUFC12733]|uniref:Uncharacterized protein n=1 Tax=Calocera viscosa (strain TUFC12733) TaxID=1330018 RepID=A0A167H2X7_CALVF|nr:hypothetical protein CALVIDRAFT_568444 [Calocera viscosa TUFC12733]